MNTQHYGVEYLGDSSIYALFLKLGAYKYLSGLGESYLI